MGVQRVSPNTSIKRRKKYYAKKRMVKIIDSILVALLFSAIMLPAVMLIAPVSEKVSAKTLFVGGSGFENHSTIQEAIDLADPGDTVYVYIKTYYECILINKSINLIGEIILNWRPIIDGGENFHVVLINNTNCINMSGFEVRNSSKEWPYSGIYINSSLNVNISGNIIHNSHFGIVLYSSSFINIQGNEIYNNRIFGIYSLCSSDNKFINNTVHDHTYWIPSTGLFFAGNPYHNNKIIGNVLFNNDVGIHFEGGNPGPMHSNNWVINNTVYNYETKGISMLLADNNYIVGNTVYNITTIPINPWGGIQLTSCNNTSIIGNIVHHGVNGIFLCGGAVGCPPSNNIIKYNTVYKNENGIRLSEAMNNNFIENMIFNNNHSVHMGYRIEGGSRPGAIGSNFINCTLSNAHINLYMNNSLSNNFINCTLTNTSINVYMKQLSRANNFINCTLSNASYFDFNITENSHATCLNTTFDKTRVYYGDTFSTLTVKWFMHVKVKYWNGTPVSNAEIWVNETSGTNILYGLADYEGWVRWIIVNEYIEQDFNGDHIGERFYFTPHNVTATDGNLWGYADPNMDVSKVVVIILGAPPNILPPTNLTTKVVNNGDNVELEWEPSISPILDHYLIYRADSATKFDFSTPYNSSTTWPDPKNTTWVDPDPTVTAVDDDFYYIVRAANFDESDISTTSNTAGVWTRTFQAGISTFSLPLEPFVKRGVEFYCQDMNASYIKWMNHTTHTWMLHDRGGSENNTIIEMGEGYEIGFLGKSGSQTRYTFTGMPGAMIIYDDDIRFSGFDPATEARNLTVSIEPDGNVTLNWQEPNSMGVGGWYEVYYSNERDGFFKTPGIDYSSICPLVYFGNNTATHESAKANDPGARLYYMVVPFNSMGVRGASTYSIGIWTEEYLSQYDTMSIPLKLTNNHTADWYCDNIPDTVGINYFIYSEQRWSWHSTRMPGGAYDVILEMTEGYQISPSNATKFTFIGV